jgi:hypothetical protein
VFAFDPVQIVHEHLIMTETASLLAMAVYLAAGWEYLRSRSLYWLPVLAFLGVGLVSLRLVYLPVVLAAALLPLLASLPPAAGGWVPNLAFALLLSFGSTLLFQSGYQRLTGRLAHREPAYHYNTGFFLLGSVSPLVKPEDSPDPRVASAVIAQGRSRMPLTPGFRAQQIWEPEGLIAKITAAFGGDERQADRAALGLANAAIRRDPLGYLGLGVHIWLSYWRGFSTLRWYLEVENGMEPPTIVSPYEAEVVSRVFSFDAANQYKLRTLSRWYHIAGRDWFAFLLLSPFLAGLALAMSRTNPKPVVFLLGWNLLLLASTCMGVTEPLYRYLHPFSYTALLAAAVLCEKLAGLGGRPGSK